MIVPSIHSMARPLTTFIFVIVTIQFLAFGITSIDILPCHIFENLNNALNMAAIIVLFLGCLVLAFKFFLLWKTNPKPSEKYYKTKYSDLIRLSRITLVFVFLASMCALAVFIWSLCTPPVSTVRILYLVAITIFLCQSGVYMRVTTNRHSPPFMDYYLRTLYMSIYIELSFHEISETMEIYEGIGANCTRSHHQGHVGQSLGAGTHKGITVHAPMTTHHWSQPNLTTPHSGHGLTTFHPIHHPSTLHWWQETLEKAAYAFATESMLMLFVYLVEKKEIQAEIEEGESAMDMHHKGHPPVDDADLETSPLSKETVDVDVDDLGDYTKPDWVIWVIGYIFIFLAAVSVFCSWIIMHTQTQATLTRDVVTWQTVTFASMSVYIGVSFFSLRAHLLPPASLTKVDNTPDVRLLSWSAMASILWVSLNLSASVIGPTDPLFPHLCVLCAFHILQIWMQYSYLRHCMALKQDLEGKEGAWEKIHMHIIPLGLTNAIYWASNLGLWQNVELLRYSTSHLPGPVWMVVGVSLFPIVLFYRFHSFIISFLLFHDHLPFHRLFLFWYLFSSGISQIPYRRLMRTNLYNFVEYFSISVICR